MESSLIYLLRVSVASAVFYLIYLLLFRKGKDFLFNRIYLIGAMLSSFLIPLLTIRLKAPEIHIPLSFIATGEHEATIAPGSSFYGFGLKETISFLFFSGSLIFFIRLISGHLRTLYILRNSQKQEIGGTIIFLSEEDIHPFSYFNRIVIPAELKQSPYLPMILDHEQIHIREQHALDILLTELLFLFQWCNPFAWLMKDAIKSNLEFRTDDRVIRRADPRSYQLAMLSLAGKTSIAPFLTALDGSQLKNRIIMMKMKNGNKKQILRKLSLIPVITMLIMILSNKEYQVMADDIPGGKSITGLVTSAESGKPLPGIAVFVKGKSTGTITDTKGNYELTLDEEDHILLFSAPGYRNQEVNIQGKTKANISMKSVPDTNHVYTNGKKYSSEEPDQETTLYIVDEQNVRSIEGINPGNIQSITVTKKKQTGQSEEKEEHREIRIRQKETKESSLKALVVIDGKIAGNGNQTLSELDPKNIAKIEVLKDKRGTDLYGEEGKNGVILIITKKGINPAQKKKK